MGCYIQPSIEADFRSMSVVSLGRIHLDEMKNHSFPGIDVGALHAKVPGSGRDYNSHMKRDSRYKRYCCHEHIPSHAHAPLPLRRFHAPPVHFPDHGCTYRSCGHHAQSPFPIRALEMTEVPSHVSYNWAAWSHRAAPCSAVERFVGERIEPVAL